MRLKYYLVTICKHQVKDYVSPNDLFNTLWYLSKHGVTDFYGKYERHGRYKQLHYHFITRIQCYDLTSLSGFRIHYERFPKGDLPVMKRYIDKHYHPYHHTQEDTSFSNYYAYHNGFSSQKEDE